MRRIAGIVLLTLLVSLAWAAGAAAAERATLTWDTDATDVDLHVWDQNGNHAWFVDQEAIPGAQLSTDVTYGFGPEHFEEFAGNEGRTYTYGICYYASNRDDGVVPDTVATVTLTDPNGSQHTLRRRLTTVGEAYYLGSSPSGVPAYQPDNDWCPDADDGGPYHPVADSGPDPGAAGGGGCTRTRRRIGAVELCANQVTGGGPVYRATGDVRANGSVMLGDGPFTLDTDEKTITGQGTIRVLRGGSQLPIAAGALSIDARAVTEPVSGRTGTAAVDIATPSVQFGGLKVAGLPLTAGPLSASSLTVNLDPADGGGVIVQAKVKLPFAGGQESGGSLAVGVHGGGGTAVRVLGGSAGFGDVSLPGGWRLGDFSLAYIEAGDTWQATGSLQTPAFGLDLNGALADGRIDALGVGFAREIPLGTTGFILTRVAGNVTGLAVPPLRISASAWGKWGSLPNIGANGIVLLKKVTLTVDFSGSASLRGDVSFLHDPSPVNGRLALGIALSPFHASGSLSTRAKFGPFSVDGDGSIAFSSSAFTAAGGAKGSVFGGSIGEGRVVVSDTGAGVTGKVCTHPSLLGVCAKHVTLGVGMRWSNFPHVEVIGGDVQRFVTVSRAGGSQVVDVVPGRPLLIVEATGAAGTLPRFTLVAPTGKRIGTRRETLFTKVVHDRERGYASLMVLSPRSGRWRVEPSREHAVYRAQTVHEITRVHIVKVTPAGSKRHPLRRRGRGVVRVRWSSAGLPRSARVAVYVTPRRRQLGRRVAGGLRPRGGVRIPRRQLAHGANRIRLIVTDRGIPLDEVLARAVIRAR